MNRVNPENTKPILGEEKIWSINKMAHKNLRKLFLYFRVPFFLQMIWSAILKRK